MMRWFSRQMNFLTFLQFSKITYYNIIIQIRGGPASLKEGLARVNNGEWLKQAIHTFEIAQLGERRLCKPEATGSNPVISTKYY